MVLYGGGDGAMFDMLSSGAVLLWIDDKDAIYLERGGEQEPEF